MIYLTPHFTLEELTITEVRQLAVSNRALAEGCRPQLVELAKLLEQVRTACGGHPVVVHSGFRSKLLNTHIGGSANSQHLKGEAADFHIPGLDLRDVFNTVRTAGIRFGQLILEDGDGDGTPSWIHISLGEPWRDPSECNECFLFNGRTYTRV